MAPGRIPEDVIKEVLRRYDIVDTVGKYVHLTKQGKYMKGLCPFHSEKTPSFTVTPEKQIFHCYGCGEGGDVIKFIARMEEYSFPEAVTALAEEAGMSVTWARSQSTIPPEKQRERELMLEAHELTAKLYNYLLLNTEFGRAAKQYLASRGITDKLIEQFRIGFAPDRWDTLVTFLTRRECDMALMEKGGLVSAKNDGSGYVDRFRDRIMFPLWDRDGKVVAFAGRVLGEGQPKYLNSPETPLFNKSGSLYHFHAAKSNMRKSGQAVLCEGYMDVIQAWSAGVEEAVATMGTALTEQHAAILRRNASEVLICYDGDRAGQAAALKAMPILEKARLGTRVAVLPKGQDPDDFIRQNGPERFRQEIIGHPVSAVKFKLIYSRNSHTMVEEEGRMRYVKDAVRLIAELDSPIEREFYLKELSAEFGMSLETLKQDCHRMHMQMQKSSETGDNNNNSWNNGRNEKRRSGGPPPVIPAYRKAERHLLHEMMQSEEAASIVMQQLGDAFVAEDHAALAAYLYAYYAEGNEPDASRFIASLQDDRLERTAASILMMDDLSPLDERLVSSYVRVIRRERELRTLGERKEEFIRAERAGDHMLAAQIFIEINALERQLKAEPDERF
ncbi:DNA primase [Paenibacillus sp. IB182496]|uniref:DNA primase n=1 Tax=Paenibacillus sabuli TaxID=2772509 RepID=A0A927BPP1_9BACL|nr:DNA primase [Paenibacillus sabuli]MBD2844438.1 DNA primase [Paenibacillus sabuli]